MVGQIGSENTMLKSYYCVVLAIIFEINFKLEDNFGSIFMVK